MVEMTLQVPDKLAERCLSAGRWLPTILELSFMGFKTLATAAAAEVIEFLSANPSPDEVLNFHISEPAQQRLRRLLILNEAGCLPANEQVELNELQELEHIIIMLKAGIADINKRNIH